MSAVTFAALKSRYAASAALRSREAPEHFRQLQAAAHDALRHGICMSKARTRDAEIEALRSLIERRPWLFRDIEQARRIVAEASL